MNRQAYETIAAIHQTDWWYRGRQKILLAVLRRLRRQTRREPARWAILDVGCGFGAMTAALAEFGTPRGLDIEPQAVEVARRCYPELPFDVGRVPEDLPPERFDLIVLLDVLEHLDDREAVLRELATRLRPRGWLVVTVPACPSLWTGRDEMVHHRLRYRPRLLRAELEGAGLRVRRISFFNSLMFPAIWLAAQMERTLRLRPERAFQSEAHREEALFVAPPLLNRLLFAIFALEAPLVARFRLPIGVSLLAIAEKKGGE